MQRLDKLVRSFKKDTLQRSSLNESVCDSELSCLNFDAAVDTKTNKLKRRTINLSNFNSVPRNDILLQGERYRNVLLENSKEERESQVIRRRN